MATPSLRGAGTAVFTANNVATPTVLSPTKHASTVDGDLMILVTESRSITAACSTPTGWTLLTGFPKTSGTASGGKIYAFSRIADSGANDAPAPSWSGLTTGTNGDSCGARILSFADAVAAQDGTPPAANDASSTTSITIPAHTTTGGNSLVVGIAMRVNDTAHNFTTATFTERSDDHTTSGTGHGTTVSTKVNVSPGSSGTATVTPSNTTASRTLAVSFAVSAGPTKVSLTPVAESSAPISGYWPGATVGLLGIGTAGSGATSASPVAPAGLMVGDVMVLAYSSIRGSPQHTPVITGGANGTWTSLHDQAGGVTNVSRRGVVYAKVVEAADIGATFTIDGPNVNVANNIVYAVIMGINKLNAVTLARVIDASATGGEANGNNLNDHPFTAIIPAFANDLITMIANAQNFNGDTYTMTDPAVLTEQHDAGTATGDGGHIYIATAPKTTAGTTGAGTFHTATALPAYMKYVAAWLSIPFIDKSLALSILAETDAAVAQSFNKVLALTPAAETDAAIALVYGLLAPAKDLTTVTETSLAVALSYGKQVAITPVGETSAATAETASKTVDVTTAAEADAALAQTVQKQVTITTATEADAAQALDFVKPIFKDITLATETDSAEAQTAAKALGLTTATESDAAQVLSFFRAVTLTVITETDSAVAQSAYKALDIVFVAEADLATGLTVTKDIHKDLTPVTEADVTTSLLIAGGSIPIDPVFETDEAVALSFTKDIFKTLTPVAEADSAEALTGFKALDLGFVAETDTVVPLSISAPIIMNLIAVTEGDTAVPLFTSAMEHDVIEGGTSPHHATGGVGSSKRGFVF